MRILRGTMLTAAMAILALAAGAAAAEEKQPQKVGACVTTTVKEVGQRLGSGGGSAISYTNGLHQVSLITVDGIDHSKTGDKVRLCLVQLPQNCPANDDRGKVYSGINQRTHERWRESDSAHACGGA